MEQILVIKKYLQSPFSLVQKSEIFDMCRYMDVKSGLKKKHTSKIRIVQNKIERSILNIKKKNLISIKIIKRKSKFIRRRK